MISVLYFIRKINAQYIKKTNNISTNGIIIEVCMVFVPVIVMLEGWCKVFHQSTENFIIGMFIAPITIKDVEILLFKESFFINFIERIYDA